MVGKLSQDVELELVETAKKIATPGKGILAADESTGTTGKRFERIKVENNEENRCAYRELLFKSEDINKYISGVILCEETLYQTASCGKRMVQVLKDQGVIPGIKVDLCLVTPPLTEEKSTQGLDQLAERCKVFYNQGARFAKWRSVLSIDAEKNKPTPFSITENAHTLARFASICQSERLVPVVESEVLSDGSHSIDVCAEATERSLAAVFKALNDQNVLLEGCLLKTNMVTAGSSTRLSTREEIAFYTIRTLMRTVPAAIPCINFLSGGQSGEDASLNLSEMNKMPNHPWTLSFSYGRALQASCLRAWEGKPENIKIAQESFIERAQVNSEAQQGNYEGGRLDKFASRGVSDGGFKFDRARSRGFLRMDTVGEIEDFSPE